MRLVAEGPSTEQSVTSEEKVTTAQKQRGLKTRRRDSITNSKRSSCGRNSRQRHKQRDLIVVGLTYTDTLARTRPNRRVYGVRPEGNVDPAVDVHGELTSQNVLFKSETVQAAAQALGVRGRAVVVCCAV